MLLTDESLASLLRTTYHVSYPLKKAPDRAKMSGDPLKSVIG